MPDEEGGREGGEGGGWRSRMLLFFFLVLVLVLKRDGAGIRGIGSVHSFFWLGVDFVLVGSDYEGFPSA